MDGQGLFWCTIKSLTVTMHFISLFTFNVWELVASSDNTNKWYFRFRLSTYYGCTVVCGQHTYVPSFRPLRLDTLCLFFEAGNVCWQEANNPPVFKVYLWACPLSFSNTYTSAHLEKPTSSVSLTHSLHEQKKQCWSGNIKLSMAGYIMGPVCVSYTAR